MRVTESLQIIFIAEYVFECCKLNVVTSYLTDESVSNRRYSTLIRFYIDFLGKEKKAEFRMKLR